MKPSRSPWVVGIAFVAVFFVLVESGNAGDAIAHIAIGGIVFAMSAVAVFRMLKSGQPVAYSQTDTLPKRLRNWVLDEHEPSRH